MGLFDEEPAQSPEPTPEPVAEVAPEPVKAKKTKSPRKRASKKKPAETEKEVVLIPAEREEQAAEASADAAGSSSNLYEAGLLILEENRVAVSMLQRRFSIDFDEACVLLDKLQELGLIGPYVGGRNREILLSLEDWTARESELVEVS